MAAEGLEAKNLTLKLKATSFELRTRSATLPQHVHAPADMLAPLRRLLAAELPIEIRLMGVSGPRPLVAAAAALPPCRCRCRCRPAALPPCRPAALPPCRPAAAAAAVAAAPCRCCRRVPAATWWACCPANQRPLPLPALRCGRPA